MMTMYECLQCFLKLTNDPRTSTIDIRVAVHVIRRFVRPQVD